MRSTKNYQPNFLLYLELKREFDVNRLYSLHNADVAILSFTQIAHLPFQQFRKQKAYPVLSHQSGFRLESQTATAARSREKIDLLLEDK